MPDALDTEKLEHLLHYMVEHNDHHVEDLVEWVAKIRAAGRDDVAAELDAIVELSGAIGERFRSALQLMN